jgi:hypothetical protein
VLQYLLDEGCPWHLEMCDQAAEAGDLQQLQWLYEHGGVLNSTTAERAAEGGSVRILEWLQQQQQGVQFSIVLMLKAAESDNLQLCKWLHAAECPMDEYAYYHAAERCNLELLDWLFDIGCPYNVEDLCYFAMCSVDSKTIPVLQWLQQHNIFDSAATLTLALNYAGAGNTNLAATQWLRQQGAECPAVLCSEHQANPVPWRDDTLEWARAEGCTAPVHDDDNDSEIED